MRKSIAVAAALLGTALIAACSSSASSSTTTSSGTPTGLAAGATPGSFARAHYTTSLKGICPNPFVVQADWLPEADHGFLYQLIGAGAAESQFTYQGPLGSTGINLEILSGGPGLGLGVNQPSSLYVGNLVKRITPDLAFVGTDDSIQYSKQYPTTAVFAEYQKNPEALIYDPSKYQINSLATLKAAVAGGVKIYVSTTTFSFVRWLIGQGIPSSAFIGGYAGDLEKFVGANGSLLQQGVSTSEVYTLEHLTANWDKPVGYVYLADLGLPFYQSAVSVATNRLAALTPCLQKLIPLMQHALVDYVTNPAEVNGLLADYNNKGLGAAFWHTPVDLNAAAARVMLSDHLVVDTPGTTSIGGFDLQQVSQDITQLVPIDQSSGLTSFNPHVAAGDVATNQFIDPGIGLGR